METVVIERGKPDDHQGAIKVFLSKAGIIQKRNNIEVVSFDDKIAVANVGPGQYFSIGRRYGND